MGPTDLFVKIEASLSAVKDKSGDIWASRFADYSSDIQNPCHALAYEKNIFIR